MTLLALGLVVAGGWYITRPARLARLSEQLLHEVTGADVQIASAHLGWDGHVDLDGVSLRVPGLSGQAARLFEAESVRIDASLAGLVDRSIPARSVVALRPTLYVTWLGDEQSYNYEHLPEMVKPRDPDADPLGLPEIYVRRGSVRIGRVVDGRYRVGSALDLAGRVEPFQGQPTTYQFQLQQRKAGGEAGPTVRGTFDLARHHFAATLDHFRFTAEQRHLLPWSVREQWDQLEPTGALPVVAVRYQPEGGVEAEIVVEDVAVTLPVPELDMRLSQVSGRFIFADDVLRMEELTGRLGGVQYRVDGTLGGFDREAPLDVTVRAEPFVVPESPKFLDVLPAELRGHYERFDPSGRFQFHVRLHRDEPGKRLRYSGVVDVLNAKGRYHEFPFPVHNARGRVRFTHEQVVIEQIVAQGANDSTMRLAGTISPPGSDAAIDLDVEVGNVAVDSALVDALKPQHRHILQTFFSSSRYEQLVEQGIVQPAHEDEADVQQEEPDSPPAFTLGGRVNAQVQIDRPYGRGEKADVTLTIHTDDTRLLLEQWPYPLQLVDGSITIAPDHVAVNDLQLRGLTGAEARISGRINRQAQRDDAENEQSDAASDAMLVITELYVPVDKLLLASVPSPQDRWVRLLYASGAISGGGRVYGRVPGEVKFSLDGQFENVTVTPFDGRFTLDQINGALHMTRDSLSLNDVVGRHDDSRLRTDGRVSWGEGEPVYDLRFVGRNLAIDRALLDLLPPEHAMRQRLAEVFDEYQPTGRTDATLTINDGEAYVETGEHEVATEHDVDYVLALKPRELAFDLDDQRVRLHDMSGVATISGDTLSMEQLHSAFDGGSATVSGLVGLGGDRGAALQLEGAVEQFKFLGQAILPEPVWQAMEEAQLQGDVQLENGHLLWQPDAAEDRQFTFEGSLQLADLAVHMGTDITDVHGKLDVEYVRTAAQQAPQIDLRLAADRLRIADRLVAPAQLHLVSTDDARGMLEVETLRGQLYDGVITGSGSLALVAEGQYSFDLAMQGVRVQPLIKPPLPNSSDESATESAEQPAATAPAAPRQSQRQSRGRVDASLTVEGTYGDTNSRRGRGAIRVRNAELFDRPLTLALLQTANLTIPTGDAFDRAAVQYMLDGPTVHLEDIRLEAPTFAIIGTGTLEVPSRALALTFVARNPGSGTFGALSDMINVLKDELVCIKIGGTLSNPEARMVSLEGLRESWGSLFENQSGQGLPSERP